MSEISARTEKNVAIGNDAISSTLADDTLGILIHDLATPLSIISFLITSINREQPSLLSAQRAGRALHMIQQILATAKSIYIHHTPLTCDTYWDLAETVEDALNWVKPIADKKKIEIDFKKDTENGVIPEGHRSITKNQILINLLTNAIKFSPSNSTIYIRMSLEKNDILVEITDRGVGIPSHTLESICKNSKGKSSPGTAGETGAGLGLHIVKTFCGLLKIEFSLFSRSDQESAEHGTTAILRFRR